MALLEGLAFDTSNFAVGVHTICDTAGFGVGSVLLTVAARRERISRTYVCNSRGSGWPGEFKKELDAGLFGLSGALGSDASRVPGKRSPEAAEKTAAATAD
jgi:hypothetical protein